MRPHRISLVILILFATATVWGCGKSATNPGAGTSHEADLVIADLAQMPEIMDDGLSEDDAEISLGSGSGLAAIHPRYFRRVIRSRSRSFEFAFSDTDSTGRPTRATVTILTELTGNFVIRAGVPGSDSSGMDSTVKTIKKPLAELRTRRVLLRRACMIDDSTFRWRLVATSAVQVASHDHTTDIVSLRIQNAGGLDTTLTDPLAFIRLRNIPRCMPRTDVTLTVTTTKSNDLVFLHAKNRRFRFHNNGDNTYTGVWRSGVFSRGLQHVAVDAISNETLFDDTAAYDSERWVAPHVMFPFRMQEPRDRDGHDRDDGDDHDRDDDVLAGGSTGR